MPPSRALKSTALKPIPRHRSTTMTQSSAVRGSASQADVQPSSPRLLSAPFRMPVGARMAVKNMACTGSEISAGTKRTTFSRPPNRGFSEMK